LQKRERERLRNIIVEMYEVRVERRVFVLTLLLLPIVVSMAFVGTVAGAQQDSIVSVNPPLIWDTSMGPGTQFSIALDVDYIVKPWAYQLTLSFNPDVLNGVDVENGEFLGSRGGKVIVVPGSGFDNDIGELGLFAAYIDQFKKLPTGGGTLVTVTFEVVGYGSSPITLGSETGLANATGGWIVHEEDDPEHFFDGYFDNFSPNPQLWIQGAHGTHGGGAYPEWHVNLAGEEQTLYSKVANSGDEGAWVKVKFIVTWVEGMTTEEYWSNEAEIPGVYIDPDTGKKVFPLVTVQTDPFEPGPEGKYTVTASLYFKAGGMAEYAPYELVESSFGGDGTARDPATKFKVAEQM
jgi:hypothetical protein